jgi:hypothetical protein
LVLVESASKVGVNLDCVWSILDNHEKITALHWTSNPAVEVSNASHWQLHDATCSDWSVRWTLPQIHQTNVDIIWQPSKAHGISDVLRWLNIAAEEIYTAVDWHESANQQINQVLRYRGRVCDDEQSIKWGPHLPKWVCSTRYVPPVGKITMRFGEPWANSESPLKLRFTPSAKVCYFDDGGGLIDAHPSLPTIDYKIPIEPQIRRSYLMEPQVSCIRVRDGLAVVLKSVSITKSRGQWTSTCNLSFSSRLDAIHANNELLKVTINGYDFFLLCESPSLSKIFNAETYSATGRGRLAELATPYKKATNFVNLESRSFMGLMADIIANSGWTVTGAITDYPIPANGFSYANKTPAEAINLMANAIGGMLDINDETQTINVIPQWPVVPWETSTAIPDVILHDSVILEFNEHLDIRPPANAVFVRGEQQGVAVKVKRFGTAGDNFAVDIVDKLITDNQAARMRGTTELANAGNKIQNSIRTKVLNDLPPIRPGMLIGVRKGTEVFKSVCDASTITASVNSSNGQITVNQTISLLRNENTL